MKAILLQLFLLAFAINLTAQTTNMVVLNLEETTRLKYLIQENDDVKKLYSAILKQAKAGLHQILIYADHSSFQFSPCGLPY